MDHLREIISSKNPNVVRHAAFDAYSKTPTVKKPKSGNNLSKYFFHGTKINDCNPSSFCIYHKEKSLQGCIKNNNVQYLKIDEPLGMKI